MTIAVQDWMVEDAQRLAECRHDHPFSILGPQPQENGAWVIRVWMPEARTVTLLIGSEEIAMTSPHHPWIFEAGVNHNPGSDYRVRVSRGEITRASRGSAQRTV